MQVHRNHYISTHRNYHRSIHSVYADLQDTYDEQAFPTAESMPCMPLSLSRTQTEKGNSHAAPLLQRTGTRLSSDNGLTLPLVSRTPSSIGFGSGSQMRAAQAMKVLHPMKRTLSCPRDQEEDDDALPPLMIRRPLSRPLSNTFAPTPMQIPVLPKRHTVADAATGITQDSVRPLVVEKRAQVGRYPPAQTGESDDPDRREEQEVEGLLMSRTKSRIGSNVGSSAFDVRPLRAGPKSQWPTRGVLPLGGTRPTDEDVADADMGRDRTLYDHDEQNVESYDDDQEQEEIDFAELERVIAQLEMDEMDNRDVDLPTHESTSPNVDMHVWLAECGFTRLNPDREASRHLDQTFEPGSCGGFATWSGPRTSYASTAGSTISRGKDTRLGLSLDLFSNVVDNAAYDRLWEESNLVGHADPPLQQAEPDAEDAKPVDTLDRKHRESECGVCGPHAPDSAASVQRSGRSHGRCGPQKKERSSSCGTKLQPPIYLSKGGSIEKSTRADAPSSPCREQCQTLFRDISPRIGYARSTTHTLLRPASHSPKLGFGDPQHVRRHRAVRPRLRPRRSVSFSSGGSAGVSVGLKI